MLELELELELELKLEKFVNVAVQIFKKICATLCNHDNICGCIYCYIAEFVAENGGDKVWLTFAGNGSLPTLPSSLLPL